MSSVVGAGISQNDLDKKNAITRQERLATAFRERMTEGQKFEGTGQYRQGFFEEVIDRALDVRIFIGFVALSVLMGFRKAIHIENGTEKKRSSGLRLPRPYRNTGVPQAGAKLTSFICPPKGFCTENQLQRPIVILAFDEAHQLVDSVYGQNWSLLSELRRVLLLGLAGKPIFALFLSTAADQFKPNDIQDHPPITETSFDALAFTAEEGVTTLDEVAKDKWMSHLGRPLFASLIYSVERFTHHLEQLRS